MGKKEFRVKTTEFFEKEIGVGEKLRVVVDDKNRTMEMEGKVTSSEYSPHIGIRNAYEIDTGKGKVFVKIQNIGEEKPNDENEAIALSTLSGVELWGRNVELRTESGPILARITLQREATETKSPKEYLRAAAIARNMPYALGTKYIVTDLGPKNVQRHPFDIYIIPEWKRVFDEQITRTITVEQYLAKFGPDGIRALAEIHEKLKNKRYAVALRRLAEDYESGTRMGVRDSKTLAKAYATALRDYPKTKEFWEGITEDLLKEINDLRRLGVRGKSVENVVRYARRTLARRGVSWREKIWHTAIINKNLTKLWLYAMKRKGVIKFRNVEPPRRRAGPSQRL